MRNNIMHNKRGGGEKNHTRMERKRKYNLQMVEEYFIKQAKKDAEMRKNKTMFLKKSKSTTEFPEIKIKPVNKSERRKFNHKGMLFNHLSPNRNIKNFHVNDFYSQFANEKGDLNTLNIFKINSVQVKSHKTFDILAVRYSINKLKKCYT